MTRTLIDSVRFSVSRNLNTPPCNNMEPTGCIPFSGNVWFKVFHFGTKWCLRVSATADTVSHERAVRRGDPITALPVVKEKPDDEKRTELDR